MLPDADGRPAILFCYWGRRGAIGRYLLGIRGCEADFPGFRFEFSVSDGCEEADALLDAGAVVHRLRTFSGPASLALRTAALPAERRRLARLVRDRRVAAAVTVMPHVWSPLLSPALRAAGARYGVCVHDAVPHPGDRGGMVVDWLLRDARDADAVFALSRHVAEQLRRLRRVPPDRLHELFHPTLDYGGPPRPPRTGPPRFLFFGRILPYKGLPVLADAVERLAARGAAPRLSVVGEGDPGDAGRRLAALGAELDVRWVPHGEVGDALARHDVLVLPYVEASQSGVVGAALGAGLPVIASRVGGLAEQVDHEVSGLLVPPGDPAALAAAMDRISRDPALEGRLSAGAAARAGRDSMRGFVGRILDVLRPGRAAA
jgi:glycosyltransferase involved in cell wall biosynthesis